MTDTADHKVKPYSPSPEPTPPCCEADRAEKFAMTKWSPAAQAVLKAYLKAPANMRLTVAAVLSAAGDHVCHDWSGFECVDYLMGLASELEATDNDKLDSMEPNDLGYLEQKFEVLAPQDYHAPGE